MTRSAIIAVLIAALAGPVQAQAPSTPELRLPELLDEALRKMMEDMKPSLDEALDLMREFGRIDDPRNYLMPEVLPNGDIIIRRRPDAPEFRREDPPRDEPPAGEPTEDGSVKT